MLARMRVHTHVSFELNMGDLDQGKKIHYDFTFFITLKQLSLGNLRSVWIQLILLKTKNTVAK